jgi:hypothetical protein
MEKQQIINEIEKLYPADCIYDDTTNIGKVLLEKAKTLTGFTDYHEDWRDYSIFTLQSYLNLCKDYNKKAEKELFEFLNKPSIADAVSIDKFLAGITN